MVYLYDVLNANGILGLVSDQDAKGKGVFVNFFDQVFGPDFGQLFGQDFGETEQQKQQHLLQQQGGARLARAPLLLR